MEIRSVAELGIISVSCFLSSLNGDDLVVKSGFGHTLMLAGQGPRTTDLGGDLV